MMHLTNYSLNKQNTSVKFEINGDDYLNTGHKRTWTFVQNWLKENGHDHEKVLEKIKEMCTMIMLSFHPFLLF
jgi:hypothetical protein